MKLRSTILGLVLVKLMLSSSLFAQTPSTNAARLNVALVRGFPGVGVDVPITLHNTGTVVAAQFDLGYPLGHLVPGVPGPGNFDGNVAVRSRQVSPGVLRYLIYSPQNSVLKTNGTVGTLPVSVPAGERTGGAMTASAVVMAAGDASLVRPVQVQSGGVLVSQVFRADDGLVYLLFNAESNQTYVVQAATNLVNWVNISTNTATSDYFTLTDTGAVGLPYRFFPSRAGGWTVSLAQQLSVFADPLGKLPASLTSESKSGKSLRIAPHNILSVPVGCFHRLSFFVRNKVTCSAA